MGGSQSATIESKFQKKKKIVCRRAGKKYRQLNFRRSELSSRESAVELDWAGVGRR